MSINNKFSSEQERISAPGFTRTSSEALKKHLGGVRCGEVLAQRLGGWGGNFMEFSLSMRHSKVMTYMIFFVSQDQLCFCLRGMMRPTQTCVKWFQMIQDLCAQKRLRSSEHPDHGPVIKKATHEIEEKPDSTTSQYDLII